MLGAKASVTTKVTVPASPSSRLASQACFSAPTSIRLTTARMIIAARTGRGSDSRYEVKNSSVTRTAAAANNEERPVRAFDARFSAEREKDPLTGIDPQNAAAIF